MDAEGNLLNEQPTRFETDKKQVMDNFESSLSPSI